MLSMRKTRDIRSGAQSVAKRVKRRIFAMMHILPPSVLNEAGADLVEKLQQICHYPQRFKKAETDEQKAKNIMAKRISMP